MDIPQIQHLIKWVGKAKDFEDEIFSDIDVMKRKIPNTKNTFHFALLISTNLHHFIIEVLEDQCVYICGPYKSVQIDKKFQIQGHTWILIGRCVNFQPQNLKLNSFSNSIKLIMDQPDFITYLEENHIIGENIGKYVISKVITNFQGVVMKKKGTDLIPISF